MQSLKKRSRLLALTAVLAGAAALTFAWAFGNASSAKRPSSTRTPLVRPSWPCPSPPVGAYTTIDHAIEAARRLVIDGKTIETQGVRRRLTRKNTHIGAAIQLGIYEAPEWRPGKAALLREAERRCGRKVALGSWAIEVQYTLTVIAVNRSTVFLALTRSGWRTY